MAGAVAGAYVRWGRAEVALREGRPLSVGLLPRLVVGGLLIVVVETVMVVLLKTHP